MERHRTRRGGYRYHYETALPWDGSSSKEERRPRAIRNGLVREQREYIYRPTQHEGMYVAFMPEYRKSFTPTVVHILAPGMTPASACWRQLGDGDDHKTFRIYDKPPKKARPCGYCWRAIEREKERCEGNGEAISGSSEESRE